MIGRRSALKLLCGGSPVFLSGCSGLRGPVSDVTIKRITVDNLSTSKQTISVRIVESGDVIFGKRLELDGAVGGSAKLVDGEVYERGLEDIPGNSTLELEDMDSGDERSESIQSGDVVEVYCGVDTEGSFFLRQREYPTSTE